MIYLDNASTSDSCWFLNGKFANPNSPHALGKFASEILEESRNRVKKILGVSSGEVIFGGTTSMLIERINRELNNNIESTTAIDFCSKYEHDCIADNSLHLIDFNNNNFQLFNERCAVYAHIHTNNITGRVYDIDCYGRKIRENNDFFIVDTTATWGHTFVPEHLEEWCDCVVGSAHKFYGPEGTGFMWLSDRFLDYLLPCTVTKSNEYSFWPGTPAVTNIRAMVNCLEFFNDEVTEKQKVWEKLTNILLEELKENNVECSIVDYNKPKTWAINALTLPGFNGDALVQYLSGKGIYISAGHSACASEGDYRVLKACGLSEKEAKSTVRISFGYSTTEEQIKELAKEIVNFKNKFM